MAKIEKKKTITKKYIRPEDTVYINKNDLNNYHNNHILDKYYKYLKALEV